MVPPTPTVGGQAAVARVKRQMNEIGKKIKARAEEILGEKMHVSSCGRHLVKGTVPLTRSGDRKVQHAPH